MPKKTVYCLAVIAAMATTISAQAESLQDAVESALNSHPTVEAAIAARDAAIENQQTQFSGYFPTIKLNASTGRVYGDNSTSRGLSVTRGTGYSWQHDGGATLTQMVFDGFRVSNRVDAAKYKRKAKNNNIVNVREDLALQTTLAYMDVLRAHEEREHIKDYTRKIDDYISRINKMVKGGAAHEADLQQAKDIRIMLDTIRYESEGRLESASIRYSSLVGRHPDSEMALPDLGEKTIPEEKTALNRALEKHPILLASVNQAMAAESEMDVEKGSLYPEFNAEISYYKKDLDDLIGGEVVDAKGLLRMSWNFSTGGEQLNRIEKKKYDYINYKARVNEARRQLEEKIRTAYTEMETSSHQYDVQSRRKGLQEALLKIYKNQFEGGSVTLLQLLQSENQLFSAGLEKIGAKYRLLAARYNVLASMGELQKALNVVPASYDTSKNRQRPRTSEVSSNSK